MNKENVMGDEKMNEYYSLLEIGKLNLKYPVTVNGLDGECFTYSIYFENADIASKYAHYIRFH